MTDDKPILSRRRLLQLGRDTVVVAAGASVATLFPSSVHAPAGTASTGQSGTNTTKPKDYSPEAITKQLATYTVPQPNDSFVMAQARKTIDHILKGKPDKKDLVFLMNCTHGTGGYNSKICFSTFPVSKDHCVQVEIQFGEQDINFRLTDYSGQQNRLFSSLIGVDNPQAQTGVQFSVNSPLPKGWKGRAGDYFPDTMINADAPFSDETEFNEATQRVEGQPFNEQESGNRPMQSVVLKVMRGEKLQQSDFQNDFFYKCGSPRADNGQLNLGKDLNDFGKRAREEDEISSDYLLTSAVLQRADLHQLDSATQKVILFDKLTPAAIYVDMDKGIQFIVPDYREIPRKVKEAESPSYPRQQTAFEPETPGR